MTELPPLPPKGYGNDGHSDEAMREYAKQAVEAEKRSCAALAQSLWYIDGQRTADEFAAAIHNRTLN